MIELGRFADAIRALGPVLAAAPDDARAWCLLARAFLGGADLAAAVAAARRASALDPAADWPYRIASTALTSLGRPADAVGAARQARTLAPWAWRSHVCLAQAAASAGQHELAAEAARAALAIAPQEPDVHVAAGKAALARGDLAAAAASQRAALTLDPAHAGAVNELGLISLRSRDRASAAGYFAQAARSEPGCAVFGQNAALALAGIARLVAAEAVATVLLAAGTAGFGLAGRPVLAALAAAGAGVMTWRTIGTLTRLPAPVRRQLARSLRARPQPGVWRWTRPARGQPEYQR